MSDNKNVLLAILLSAIVLFGWEYFVARPQMQRDQAQQAQLLKKQKKQSEPAKGAVTPSLPQAVKEMSREEALKATGARIAIDTPTVDGSILLKGARFDDLRLKCYHENAVPRVACGGKDPKNPEIVLFAPDSTHYPYYASFGWLAQPGAKLKAPGSDTVWTRVHGDKLAPGKPVTLEWNNGQGLVFTRTIAVDSQYMFTISDSVKSSAGTATLYPYATIFRRNLPNEQRFALLHEGFVGVSEGSASYVKYDKLKPGENNPLASTGGWVGVTDKYWMAAAIPPQKEKFSGEFRVSGDDATKLYLSDYRLEAHVVAPGRPVTVTQHLFAGAKVVRILQAYEDTLGIEKFHYAIDWGWFWFFTQPIFWLLDQFNGFIGNFGIAILLLTVTIKLIFFPLANTSYRSMSKMKKLQPEMEKIRERFAEDRVRQQQEMMDLYKREKANPVSGCLPMIIQIPIFFSLYKVLLVTIEMRHAPFFGWIHDLSAPDPTSILNLFGLIPYNPHDILPSFLTFLSIGIWPILMGMTQWLQTKMNPAPADPVQARMFAFMPLIFTFMLATFPAGLVIYWTWNNLLSVTQQYVMMRREGVEIHLFKNLGLPGAAKARAVVSTNKGAGK